MDEGKKQIRKACNEAANYTAWRNPFGTWFVTLYDENDEGTLEFQFSDSFPAREKRWVWNLLAKIDERKEKDE